MTIGDEYDVDVTYRRQLTRFLALYAGAGLEREESAENRGIAGVSLRAAVADRYRTLRIDSKGHFRLELESELQLTERTRFHWNWNTDDEYRVRLSYEFNKKTAVTGGYDSDFKLGAGFEYRY